MFAAMTVAEAGLFILGVLAAVALIVFIAGRFPR